MSRQPAPPAASASCLSAVRLIAEEISKDDGGANAKFDQILPHVALRVDVSMAGLTSAAAKIASKCKRNKRICTRDVERAIRMEYKNAEDPVLFVSDQAKTLVTSEERRLFCFREPEINLKDYVQEGFVRLPRAPIAPTFAIHWLAVDGIQPTIPENDLSNLAQDNPDSHTLQKKRNATTMTGGVSDASHEDDSASLTRELALYLDKVTASLLKVEGIATGDVSLYEKASSALGSLSHDAGIDRLVPHFVRFVMNHIRLHLKSLPALWTGIKISEALVQNENIKSVDLYLHELLPALISCVVGKALCQSPAENHWSLREAAASVVARICQKYGEYNADLQPRVVEVYREALSQEKPLTTQYGGVVGLVALGPMVVNHILVPVLYQDQYLEKLIHVANQSSNVEHLSDAEFERSFEAFKVLNIIRDGLSQGPMRIVVDRYSILSDLGYEWPNYNQDLAMFI